MRDGLAVFARDEAGASDGDDPFVTVDVDAGTASVADDPPEGPWRVEIALDGP